MPRATRRAIISSRRVLSSACVKDTSPTVPKLEGHSQDFPKVACIPSSQMVPEEEDSDVATASHHLVLLSSACHCLAVSGDCHRLLHVSPIEDEE